jgi:transposase
MRDKKANSYMEHKSDLPKEGTERLRLRIVKYAIANNISKAATKYLTTRKTVRKWVNEYKRQESNHVEVAHGKGVVIKLCNKSRLGQRHPNKLDAETENKIILFRLWNPELGSFRIKEHFNLTCSETIINKKLKQHGLIRQKEPKSRKDKDMSEMRAFYKPLEKIQIDVKYLIDVPSLCKGIWFKMLPKYQITARCYKCGLTFIGYSYFKDSTSIGIFVAILIEFLKLAGVDLSNICLQSDNGGEFRHISKKKGFTLYEEILMNHGIKYEFIPIASPTFNSDVESFHHRIEPELYNYDTFDDEKTLFLKAWLYMCWYNQKRKNRGKEKKSPAEILKDYNFNNIETLTSFPPIFVDKFIKDIELVKSGGYLKYVAPRGKQKNY